MTIKGAPITDPKTREEAVALMRRSSHWSSGLISANTGRWTQKPTAFRAADHAALVAMIERRGWVRQPDNEFGENWRHPGEHASWSFLRACQITLHALAGRTVWCGRFLAPLKIPALPSAAEQVSP